MPDSAEIPTDRDRGRSVQTIGVIAGLILFICVVFAALFGAGQFIG